MSDTAGWLAQQGIGGPVAWQDLGQLARRQAAEDECRAERAEAERLAQLEEANDARAVAFYMNGVQPGAQLQRSMALADLEAEMGGLRDQLTKLQRRHDRLTAEGRDEAELASRSYQMAQRSAPSPPGLGDAGERVAAVQRELAVQQRADAILARARSRQRPAPRVVTRSASLPKAPDQPCGCGVPGCTAYPSVDGERAAYKYPPSYNEFMGPPSPGTAARL
jgi:hypothetical protein